MSDGTTMSEEFSDTRTIQSHVESFCDDRGVTPIYAVDYGSRGRGLAHEQSDYDVFVIYLERPVEAALDTESATMDRTIPADESGLGVDVELHGWSLSKFLGNDGICGSNPTAMWATMVSPDGIYYEHPECERQLLQLAQYARSNFKPYALINHYRSMAASNYGKYIDDDYVVEWSDEQIAEFAGTSGGQIRIENGTVTMGILGYEDHTVELTVHRAKKKGIIRESTSDVSVKRYIAIMQALLRSRYIEQTFDAPVPANFAGFVAMCYDEGLISTRIKEILDDQIKRKRDNDYDLIGRITALDNWIEMELDREIDPEPYVKRQPDTQFVYGIGEEIVATIYDDE